MPLRIQWPSWDQRRTDRALMRAGRMVLDEAKAHTPTDGGELKRSGSVEKVDDQTVRVGFSEPYAVRQHYLKRYRHRNGAMLFLYDATVSQRRAVGQALADEISRAMRNR